jgi:hypothetical protein
MVEFRGLYQRLQIQMLVWNQFFLALVLSESVLGLRTQLHSQDLLGLFNLGVEVMQEVELSNCSWR